MPNTKKTDTNKQRFWQHPWGYKESFTVAFAVLIIGFLLEVVSPSNAIYLPRWPFNLVIILVVIAYVVLTSRMIQHPVIRWLSSTPAAISSISLFTVLILFMGFIPQSSDTGGSFLTNIGLTHVTRSWPYLMLSFYLLIILGYTIVRRIYPFTIKNMAFTLNHAGLWIVIVAASLGSSDMQKLNMQLVEDKVTFTAYDQYGHPRQMNFAVKLFDFKMKEYPPSIGLLDEKNRSLKLNKDAQLIEVTGSAEGILGDWGIKVKKYYEFAEKDTSGGYIESSRAGSAPVALIEAKNNTNDIMKSGWVTSGSFIMPSEYLSLGDGHTIVMTIPRAQEYSSDIRFFKSMNNFEDHTIKVNQPVTIDGWKIYQTGYNEDMGRWSKISIIEIVKDPWLPVVYTGIFMVLLGSVYLVWMGRSKNIKKEEKDDLV